MFRSGASASQPFNSHEDRIATGRYELRHQRALSQPDEGINQAQQV